MLTAKDGGAIERARDQNNAPRNANIRRRTKDGMERNDERLCGARARGWRKDGGQRRTFLENGKMAKVGKEREKGGRESKNPPHRP